MTDNNTGNDVSPAQAAQQALEEFRAELKLLGELGMKSKAKAVGTLRPIIERLNSIGFSQEKLVSVMKEEGLEMTVGYLKTTLSRKRKETDDEG